MYNDMIFLIKKYDNTPGYPDISSVQTVQSGSIPVEVEALLPTLGPASITS